MPVKAGGTPAGEKVSPRIRLLRSAVRRRRPAAAAAGASKLTGGPGTYGPGRAQASGRYLTDPAPAPLPRQLNSYLLVLQLPFSSADTPAGMLTLKPRIAFWIRESSVASPVTF